MAALQWPPKPEECNKVFRSLDAVFCKLDLVQWSPCCPAGREHNLPAKVPRWMQGRCAPGWLVGVCACFLLMGSTSFAADVVSPEPQVDSGVQADQEVEALVLKAEQQVSAGRTVSPEHDNAMETWSRITERASSTSPRISRALAVFIEFMRNRAAEERKAGNIVWLDFAMFADAATKFMAHTGDSASSSAASSPAANWHLPAEGDTSPGPAAAARNAQPVDRVASPAAADLPRSGAGAAAMQMPSGKLNAADGSAVKGAADMSAAVPTAAAGNSATGFAVPAARPARNAPTAQQQSMAALYVSRGDEMLAMKDVSAARKFYAYAADAGSAHAATALGMTHDPEFLSQLGVVGLRPDPAMAAAWYRRAAALGDSDARAQLSRLGTEADKP